MHNESASPVISVITSTYNAEKCLNDLANSIREQTFKNIEWIVIDGGSQDRTVNIIEKNSDIISYWISEQDTGIYEAWNKALRRANGDWILFLGADDVLLDKEIFFTVAKILSSIHTNILVAYGKVMLINKNNENLYIVGCPWEEAKTALICGVSLPHQAVFHRREYFIKHGDFDSKFSIAGDYEMLLRELGKSHGYAFFFPEILVGMRLGGISSNPGNIRKILKENCLAREKNGLQKYNGKILMAYGRCYIRSWLVGLLGGRCAYWLMDCYRRLVGLSPHWTRM